VKLSLCKSVYKESSERRHRIRSSCAGQERVFVCKRCHTWCIWMAVPTILLSLVSFKNTLTQTNLLFNTGSMLIQLLPINFMNLDEVRLKIVFPCKLMTALGTRKLRLSTTTVLRVGDEGGLQFVRLFTFPALERTVSRRFIIGTVI